MSMILYNFRYRGPFEYDKFILNVFQLSNEIKRMNRHIDENGVSNIVKIKEELDKIFNELTDINNNLSDILNIKERLNIL